MSMKEEILKEYRYKTDLHVHALPISKCSEFTPDALAEAYTAVGLDTLVLTNHFTPAHLDAQPKEEFLAAYWQCYEDVLRCAEEKVFLCFS